MLSQGNSASSGGDARFRILRRIGEGGMARVYLAESKADGVTKLVVVKVLDPELAKTSEFRRSFRREAQLSARLQHANIVQVHGVFEDGVLPFMVMEYLDGLPFSDILRTTAIPLRLHLQLIAEMLAGLHYFHELRDNQGNLVGAVHRDVSPHNVMVLFQGVVKVLDFGIAKVGSSTELNNDDATRTGVIKGKLRYMAPEQMLGERDLDRRADIFAAGVMLWEAVMGRRMWGKISEQEVLQALAMGKIPPIDDVIAAKLPAPLLEAIRSATQPKREDRPATAQDLLVLVERSLVLMGGLVHSREISAFMASNFANEQNASRAQLNKALSGEVTTDTGLSGLIGRRIVREDGEDTPTHYSNPNRAVPSLPVQEESNNVWLYSGFAVALLIVVAVVVLGIRSSNEAAQAEIAKKVVVEDIKIQLIAFPSQAVISFNGEEVASNPFTLNHPNDNTELVFLIQAEGYHAETREIRANQNQQLIVNLQAVAPAPPPPVKKAVPTELEVEEEENTQIPANSPRPTPAGSKALPAEPSAPSVEAPKAPSTSCSPPYRVEADGTKVFKPECL